LQESFFCFLLDFFGKSFNQNSIMMRAELTIWLFLITHFINVSYSQEFRSGAEHCSYSKSHSSNSYVIGDRLSNAPTHSFNVLDYKFYIDLYNNFRYPFPSSFTANIEIKFMVDSSLNSVKFNAVNSSLIIDSVGMTGVSFVHSGNILTINLNRSYNHGEITAVKIYYRHKNLNDSAFYNSTGIVVTDCEPEGARKWFPCWDKPSDKATTDITVKVPSNVLLGSNGRLADSTVIGDSLYYHWVSRDPMATYLVVLTGRSSYYLDILYWHKISNPADSIPIRFYWNPGENLDSLNKIKNLIFPLADLFSRQFTEHPFEKNGFATVNTAMGSTAAMENQTLTVLYFNCWQEWLVVHEFAHQWFGDMITCATWADIWLNEGFATYCESIWEEYRRGYNAYKANIVEQANYYLANNPGFPIYNPGWINVTPPGYLLFNLAVIYYKGPCVLHMLRYVLNDSTMFFNIFKSYASDTLFRYKNATTADFVEKVNSVTGQDLNWFFDEWVYEPNHPRYQNTYNTEQLDSTTWKVVFNTRQTQSNPPFFKMPIEIKFYFSTSDTIVQRVMNNINDQTFEFTFNRRPFALQFDPHNDIVLKTATTAIGIEKNSSDVPLKYWLYQNYPNPFNASTFIRFDLPKAGHTKIVIYNIQGKEVGILVNQRLDAGSYETEWIANNYPSGVYFFRIESGDPSTGSGRSFTETKKMVLVK
jgi:aminopeptidase N